MKKRQPAPKPPKRVPGSSFDRIMSGLEDALRHAEGDATGARVHHLKAGRDA